MTRDIYTPLSFGQTAHQQAEAWYAMQNDAAGSAGAAAEKGKDDDYESAQSLAWKRRAMLLLDEGRAIYGSEKATQQVFSDLVSFGEETARNKRQERRQLYSELSPLGAWIFAAIWTVFLTAPFAVPGWVIVLLAEGDQPKFWLWTGIIFFALVCARRGFIAAWAKASTVENAASGSADVR